MGTNLTEIVDLFLGNIDDYKLNLIYTTSGSITLNTYVEPWLLQSINDFLPVCDQDLTYTSISTTIDGSFTETLTQENKVLLAQIMVIYWLERNIQNNLSFNNYLQDRDFKGFSPANITKSKQDFLNTKREEISQKIVDYSLRKNDWVSWDNQIFSGSTV
jgi:hypothetical protein